jgi:capsule polysaccharide export protein KpsE/RkpR
VGLVDEPDPQFSGVATNGDAVSEPARSMARESRPRDDIALAQPEVETIQNESRELELSRQRAVAAQRFVWVNRRFIFRATVVGALLSTLIAFLIPKRFQTTARLMPPDQESSGMGMAMMAAASGGLGSQIGSGLGSVAGDLLGLKNSSDLFIGILQSRTVQDDLINKFDLRKVYSDSRMEDARQDLAKHTGVAADRKSGIITIQVEDKSPTRAAAMAGEYINELNQVVTLLNTSSAHRERVFLEDRLTQVKQDLETAEQNFSQFATKNTALDIPAQGKAMIEAAATLEGQLIAAQTELQGLKQVYADGNVRVRSTQARVDELRRQVEKSLGSKSGDPGTGNGQNRQSLYPSIRELPTLGVGYADLFRNTKIQEAVFQTLTQQYELAKVQEAKETPSVKVLDSPDVPEKKSFPPRLLIILLGAALAMAGSIFWIFGLDAWDRTEQDDPQKAFAQEVLHTVQAHLPWAATNGSAPGSIGSKVWSRIRRSKEHSDIDR